MSLKSYKDHGLVISKIITIFHLAIATSMDIEKFKLPTLVLHMKI